MILTFESVDEILQCDHSNDSSSVVLSRGTIYILVFYKIKFEICLEFNYNKLSFFFQSRIAGVRNHTKRRLCSSNGESSTVIINYLTFPFLWHERPSYIHIG